MSIKHILCYSGGKDSTAMLIYILENNLPLEEILYVDVGWWIWEEAKHNIDLIQEKFGVKVTSLNVEQDFEEGFKKWGFPSFVNRWCTGIKRDTMAKYLKEKYPYDEIVQYIGYCSDEKKRTSKKLYSKYETKYPLVEAGISTERSFEICKENGFDFGGVYEHHSHFNCWLCPLQKVSELEYVYKDQQLWDKLRNMQNKTDGSFYPHKTIFQLEQRFWENKKEELKEMRMKARRK